MHRSLADALLRAANAPGPDLAASALVIARLEYPHLEPEAYIAMLDAMGAAARDEIERQVDSSGNRSVTTRIDAFNQSLFEV